MATVNKKFNITLLVMFCIAVLVVSIIIYKNYQKKKELERKTVDEVDKIKADKLAEAQPAPRNPHSEVKKEYTKNQPKQDQPAAQQEKNTEKNTEKNDEVLIVEENPTILPKTQNSGGELQTDNIAEAEVIVDNKPAMIDEADSPFIGAEIFTIPSRSIRMFAEPNLKSTIVASFSSNPNGLYIGKVERSVMVTMNGNSNRWFLIKMAQISSGLSKGYVKQSAVDVKTA